MLFYSRFLKHLKSIFQDETERTKANPYLSAKLDQGKKDMEEGKGTKIALEDLWK
jgi:hypothetical protein